MTKLGKNEMEIFVEGVDRGIEIGKAEGIKLFVSALREVGASDKIIVQKLQEKYSLTQEEAKRLFNNVWGGDASKALYDECFWILFDGVPGTASIFSEEV